MKRIELVFATLCLNKQLSTMEYIHTNYGNIELDEEMTAAVETALREILEKRLALITEN